MKQTFIIADPFETFIEYMTSMISLICPKIVCKFNFNVWVNKLVLTIDIENNYMEVTWFDGRSEIFGVEGGKSRKPDSRFFIKSLSIIAAWIIFLVLSSFLTSGNVLLVRSYSMQKIIINVLIWKLWKLLQYQNRYFHL